MVILNLFQTQTDCGPFPQRDAINKTFYIFYLAPQRVYMVLGYQLYHA